MSASISRREFIGTTAAGAGAMFLAGHFGARRVAAAGQAPGVGLPPVKIHKVYVGRSHVAWPKPAFDPKAEVEKFEKRLAAVEQQLGDIRFVGGELVQNAADAAKVAPGLAGADGVLLVHLSLGTLPLMQQIVDAGRPTAIFSQPFSGHEWMFIKQWEKAGKRVALFATSDYGELATAAALLRVPARMRQSRVVAVPGRLDGTKAACDPKLVKERLGTDVVSCSYERLIEAHKAVDPKLAEAEADWTSAVVLLDKKSDDFYQQAQRGEPMTTAQRLEFRRDQVRAVQRVLESVDKVYSLAGSAAVWTDKPLERYWRDLRTGGSHICNIYDTAYTSWSNYEFNTGGPVNTMH